MMKATIVDIPVHEIVDRNSFHIVFQAALGFPQFYGRNLDAWIDCMHTVDDPAAGMVSVTVEVGALMVLAIHGVEDFRRRCPQEYEALVECVAAVNQGRVIDGLPPVLALAFV
ncbi:barnase inhibitor [Caulobacter sp. Root487D2Y]|nr:barnase inhibitor [Caulobacter sp. Root487D2Y]